ncbi:hypothetical protein ACFOFO_24745 [Undibacterium arcticum]|uniref:Uncharacterized protein n=1 Tax=Undibacterium arcticum TaxID=1762892 RepID=A0ABV7FBN5_9BURK
MKNKSMLPFFSSLVLVGKYQTNVAFGISDCSSTAGVDQMQITGTRGDQDAPFSITKVCFKVDSKSCPIDGGHRFGTFINHVVVRANNSEWRAVA